MNEKRRKIVMLLQLIRMLLLLKQKNARVRTIGVKNLFKRRLEQGDGHNLLNELRFESAMFYNYTRLNYERFDYLLSLVGPKLTKRKIKTAICPKQRLALTLRHLAVGDSQASLSFAYRVGRATVSVIVKETLIAIIGVLRKEFLVVPKTKVEWKNVAAGFDHRWNLPHCLGAIDGRHVHIQCPKASGSTFFNYRKTFSINLMAVAGSDYSLLAVDCGAEGSLPDSAVFQDAEFGKRLEQNKLNLPDAEVLPKSDKHFPYFFVGDAAFQLRENLMKPYAVRKLSLREAIYNYRISRARRVVENTFGILVNRWQIFKKPLLCSLQTADLVVIATVCLHNFIIRTRKMEDQQSYIATALVDIEQSDGSVTPGTWRGQGDDGALQPRAGTRSRNSSKSATALRLVLTDYVNDEDENLGMHELKDGRNKLYKVVRKFYKWRSL